ncbi:MAG: hybrid sensor histidine kinase/response regulator, partial [Syntrophobacteraceae bacterium CG07_land_8_20_14_0_80_61_8]
LSGRIVNYVAVKRDITEQLQLAAQFQQAQKMEAVGLLAGGVAHDFNNKLTVIRGYAELALNKVDPAQSLHADLEKIIKAADRSKEITQQLLAFARKQTILPVVLDLNRTVGNMLNMLRQLIGEDIDLVWLPDVDLGPVKLDPAQIDQILANLCVNARDAIADVGRVTIETGNVVFDETYCAHHPGVAPGEYVLLTVSDDGSGMDQDTLDQLFEPFFTSKGLGKGTGLGLSTVYGIVKQNNGFINVYSELGTGTVFKIYLPRYLGDAVEAGQKRAAELPPSSCGETVLLVEDEPSLLTMGQMMLEELGYRVLAAGVPGEAIRLAEQNASEIKLLITDVVMPEMNGRDLAERFHSLCPGIKTLFMSGYTADVIAIRGVLDEDVYFLQKPFTMTDLAIKVRDALSEK